MAGRGKGKSTGSPKTPASKAPLGAASGGEPSGDGARRRPQGEQTAPASAGSDARAPASTSAQPQHCPLTRSRAPHLFYTSKDTRTKQLVIGKDKIPPMSNDKKKRPDLPLPRNKRKATMSAPGARLVKKPATAPSLASQSPTLSRLRSGMSAAQSPAPTPRPVRDSSISAAEPRNTSLESGSTSGGGGEQRCDDCRRPAEHTVHLCDDCINTRRSCRSCRARRR